MDPPEPILTPPVLAEQEDEPRLGIIHLLVWTACVAMYLGLLRGLEQPGTGEFPEGYWVFNCLAGIGSGTALGGLVLWIARRYRGLRFPNHPGEYLWIALGILGVFGMVHRAALQLLDQTLFAFEMLQLLYFAVSAIVFLVAAIRVKTGRWRFIFFVVVTVDAVMCLIVLVTVVLWQSDDMFLWTVLSPARFLVVNVMLLVVVLMDLFQHRRYPWSHWVGPAIQLWYFVIYIGFRVWQVLLEEFSSL